MKKKWSKILVTSLLLLYTLFAITSFANMPEEAFCKRINVVIKDSLKFQFVSKSEIVARLNEKKCNPIGVSMKTIKPDTYEKLLKKMARIKSVQCYKSPNGTFNIEIEQREPIIRVMSGGYYVDRSGEIMPLSDGFSAYVPIVSGPVSKEFAKNELYKFALFLDDNDFWNAQIEQIIINYDNEVELVPRVGDHIIKLGKFDNYEYKLNKLFQVYKKGFPQTGWNKYKIIDLSYDNQVVCTIR